MLNIIDIAKLGLPGLDPDAGSVAGGAGGAVSGGPGCGTCAAFRPEPGVDGNLQVDPEIHLPSPGMDVDIAYFYNANSQYSGPFGYGRTISPNLTAQASLVGSSFT